MHEIHQFDDFAAARSHLLTFAQHALGGGAPVSLLLSGGSSPIAFYEALGTADIDWANVTAALVDERWVDPDDKGSNAALVQRHLIDHAPQAIEFVPMKTAHATPHEAAGEVNEIYARLPAPALSVLGMGPDSHTASWFAAAPEYDDVSLLDRTALVAGVTAPKNDITGDYQLRMSITARFLDLTRQALLLVNGTARLDILKAHLALPPAASPIGRAADILGNRLHIVAVTGEHA